MDNEMMNKIQSKYKSNKRISSLRAIKLYCKEQYCVGDRESWQKCTLTNCFLHKYRLGKGNRQGNIITGKKLVLYNKNLKNKAILQEDSNQ